MDEAQAAVVKALSQYADEIEKGDLRVTRWSSENEVIGLPEKGEWAESRPGPRSKIAIDFEAKGIYPVNMIAGETSTWK